MLFERWSVVHSFRDIFKVLDSLLFPVLGSMLLYTSSRQVKKVRGSFVNIGTDSLIFNSRGEEQNFSNLSEIQQIKINMSDAVITDANNMEHKIFLTDYIGANEQKEIKGLLNNLMMQLKMPVN